MSEKKPLLDLLLDIIGKTARESIRSPFEEDDQYPKKIAVAKAILEALRNTKYEKSFDREIVASRLYDISQSCEDKILAAIINTTVQELTL